MKYQVIHHNSITQHRDNYSIKYGSVLSVSQVVYLYYVAIAPLNFFQYNYITFPCKCDCCIKSTTTEKIKLQCICARRQTVKNTRVLFRPTIQGISQGIGISYYASQLTITTRIDSRDRNVVLNGQRIQGQGNHRQFSARFARFRTVRGIQVCNAVFPSFYIFGDCRCAMIANKTSASTAATRTY